MAPPDVATKPRHNLLGPEFELWSELREYFTAIPNAQVHLLPKQLNTWVERQTFGEVLDEVLPSISKWLHA